MYKASQKALFQATNQKVVGIRRAEIDYYTNVNVAIGTQAALLGGFTYNTFAFNAANPNHAYSRSCLIAYHITSAITIACAIYVIIHTMVLQVMGPGLALYGPVGSMARAAQAMRLEQRETSVAFALMMLFFSLSSVLSFWVVMDGVAAMIDSLIFLVASRWWYVSVKRIYNRLYWASTTDLCDAVARDDGEDMDDCETRLALPSTATTEEPVSQKTTKKKNSFFGKLFSTIESEKPAQEVSQPVNSAAPSAVSNTPRCEGYFLRRVITNDKDFKLFGDSCANWERRYFVLLKSGSLASYKNRQKFREDAANAREDRPLELSEYRISFYNTAKNVIENDKISVQSGRSMSNAMASTNSLKIFFQIDLVPADQLSSRWSLRCDTEEELEMWVEALREISPSSFDDYAAKK